MPVTAAPPVDSHGAPPDFYDDLNASLATAWRLLADGVADLRAPARTPTLATTGRDGAPELRTVVLRACDAERRNLAFHTDSRSAKVAEIEAGSRVGLHVYDPAWRIQLRLRCKATLHRRDAVAAGHWAETPPTSRIAYQIVDVPGARLGAPGDAVFSASATGDGADNFIAVRLAVREIEWLYLHDAGHRRALFRWLGEDWSGTWLAP